MPGRAASDARPAAVAVTRKMNAKTAIARWCGIMVMVRAALRWRETRMIRHEPPVTNTLACFLDNDAGAGRVMAHARLLLDLAQRFATAAPAGLGDAAHIANYKSGKVIIHADNGAVAVKIRQLSQRLCDELSKGGPECNRLEVKVQPRQIPCQSTPSTIKPLSAGACGTLRAASASLPDGPLRQALDALLARAARQE